MLNLTPHAIVVRGATYQPSGVVCRVTTTADNREPHDGIPVVHTTYGDVVGLPGESEVPVLVSVLVLSALAASGRKLPYRVLCPDTGPDSVIRDDSGKIIGVKRLME